MENRSKKMLEMDRYQHRRLAPSIGFAFLIFFLPFDLFAIGYTYDHLGRLTSVVYDNGERISYRYDEVSNITELTTIKAAVDSDGDGVPDDLDLFPDDEFEWADNDNDGIGNNADTDDDNDGMPDSWEIKYGFNPYNSSDAEDDPDIDDLTNAEEYSLGTNPKDADSDRDGMSDGDEVAVGRNPLLNEKGLLLAPIIPMLLEDGDDEGKKAAILVPIIQLLLDEESE